jgi:hypothetical protein
VEREIMFLKKRLWAAILKPVDLDLYDVVVEEDGVASQPLQSGH